ncbi:MAG: hypothetical protein V2A73_21745, partial [Pseudomonadota bacterium]
TEADEAPGAQPQGARREHTRRYVTDERRSGCVPATSLPTGGKPFGALARASYSFARTSLVLVSALAMGSGVCCSSNCLRNSDCEQGMVCGPEGACISPPDAAIPDSAVIDSAVPDSAVPDSAAPDSAAPDSVAIDGGNDGQPHPVDSSIDGDLVDANDAADATSKVDGGD